MSRKTKQSIFRAKLDHMVDDILDHVQSGRLKIHDYLPSEQELAEKYEISKHSVRKGLELLVEQGYIVKVPRVGNKIIEPNQKSTTTLRLGYYPSMLKQAALTELITLFHERHPDIMVELIPIPFNFDNLPLMKHYLESRLIDVAMFNSLSFRELQESDQVVELLAPLQMPEGMYPFLLPAFQSDELLYAMPLVWSPVVLAYNKNDFRTLDLPEPDSSWSWDDVSRVSAQISGQLQKVGFYYHALSDNRWPVFLLQSGLLQSMDPIREGTSSRDLNLLKESVRMSLDILNKQGLTSSLTQSNTEAEELFSNGKISMVMTTYFGLNELDHAAFEVDIAPLPALRTHHTLNLPIALAVSSRTAHLDKAKQLVYMLSTFDYQDLIRQRTLSIPAVKKAAEQYSKSSYPLPYEPSRFMLYREIIRSFQLHADMNLSVDNIKQTRDELKRYWAGLTSLDTCCNRLIEIWTTIPDHNLQ